MHCAQYPEMLISRTRARRIWRDPSALTKCDGCSICNASGCSRLCELHSSPSHIRQQQDHQLLPQFPPHTHSLDRHSRRRRFPPASCYSQIAVASLKPPHTSNQIAPLQPRAVLDLHPTHHIKSPVSLVAKLAGGKSSVTGSQQIRPASCSLPSKTGRRSGTRVMTERASHSACSTITAGPSHLNFTRCMCSSFCCTCEILTLTDVFTPSLLSHGGDEQSFMDAYPMHAEGITALRDIILDARISRNEAQTRKRKRTD